MDEQEKMQKMDAMRNALKKAGADNGAMASAKNAIADAKAKSNVAKKLVPLGKAKAPKKMPVARPVAPSDVEYKIRKTR